MLVDRLDLQNSDRCMIRAKSWKGECVVVRQSLQVLVWKQPIIGNGRSFVKGGANMSTRGRRED